MFDHALNQGFLTTECRELVVSGEDPAELLASLRQARLPVSNKWRLDVPV
jgi:hypothetical protein